MTDVLVMIRNLVLAAVLAWLGLEFSPSKPSEPDKGAPQGLLSVLARG